MTMLMHLLVSALIVQATAAEFSVDGSQAATPPGLSFRAGYSLSLEGNRVVEIYTRDAASEYVLRRTRTLINAPNEISWASSSTCPVILSLLPAMQRLPLGGLWIPNLVAEPSPRFVFPGPPVSPTDAAAYTVWGWGRQPDAALAAYRVSAGSGMIAAFVQQAEEALESCWSAEEG